MGVARSGERRRIPTFVDPRDLRGRECHHESFGVVAEDDVEVVEIASGRSHDHHAPHVEVLTTPPGIRRLRAGYPACRRAISVQATAAAALTLSDAMWPCIGIDATTSHRARASRDNPRPSAPSTSTSGASATDNS